MANIDNWISDAIGTMRSYFRIGLTGPRLKNNSGALQVRNPDDSAHANAEVNALKVHGANASTAVTITVPGSLTSYTLTLPVDDGTANQALTTDGSGILAWASVLLGTNQELVQVEAFTEATSSPLTIFTPPANSIIERIVLAMSVAASGGSPTLAVGISGTIDKYMQTTDNDLKQAANFTTQPQIIESSADVIATIVPNSQTFTGKVFVYYSNPT